MSQTNLYAAADYADALLVARRGKNVLVLLLVLVILIQLTIFFVARYGTVFQMADISRSTAAIQRQALLRYVLGITDFLGLILPILLSVVLFFIVNTLLAGRLLGAGRLTSAFMWIVLLALLLFPWQSIFNNPATAADPIQGALGVKVPGALYTYIEFVNPRVGAMFPTNRDSVAALFPASRVNGSMVQYASFLVLRWARFVGFPILALLILLAAQLKSERGLRQALGRDADVLAVPPQ